MIIDFDIKNILILVIAIINLVYGALIYLKDRKNSIGILFFLLTISVGIWGLSMFMFRSAQEEYLSLFFARILYFSAAVIPFVFIYFSTIFPEKLEPLKFWQKYILPIPFFVIMLLSLTPGYLIEGTQIIAGSETHVLFNKFYHFLYVCYINIFFLYGYFVLFRKYFKNRVKDIVLSTQIIYIIAGTFISTIISVFTNLMGPYLGFFELNWVGQIATIIMISSISYAILKHHLFNIKLVLVELAVLLLNMFLLFNVFTSHATADMVLNISVSLFVLFFSVILVRGIYKEIHDREKIEELAKEMEVGNERLRAMEGQKTEFVSIASHQLRTPLTVIKGYASMILEGTFGTISEDTRDAMGKLYKSSERIVSLVEDLLTVSRLEQGRMTLTFEVKNLTGVVQEVFADLNDEVVEASLDLSFTAEEGKDFPVSIDEKKFKQVVRHLLDNAIKYTKTPGRIGVALSSDSITNRVRLAISDTGAGMSADQVRAIFERFNLKAKVVAENHGQHEQIEGDKVDGGEQSMLEKRTPGIGLYIAQEILEAHKGTLSIESAGVNKGTTVIVELPRAEMPVEGNTEA